MSAPDYSVLLSAIDWSTTITAVLSVCAGLMAVYILLRGVRFLQAMVIGSRVESNMRALDLPDEEMARIRRIMNS